MTQHIFETLPHVEVTMPDGSIRKVTYDTVTRSVPGTEYRSAPHAHMADVMSYGPVVEIPGYEIHRTMDGKYHAVREYR